MASVNKVIIIGRLGQDPEVRQFNNGGSVTSISVATSERWTDKQTGEKKEQTEWHRISLFNRLGEIAAQYLRKGSMVYIEGSLHTRKYTDQQGIERYVTEIKASSMQMLGSNQDQQSQGQQWQGQQQQYAPQQQQQGYEQPQGQYAPHGQSQQVQQQGQWQQYAPQYQQQAPQHKPQGMGHSKYQPMGHARPTEPVVNVSDDDMPF